MSPDRFHTWLALGGDGAFYFRAGPAAAPETDWTANFSPAESRPSSVAFLGSVARFSHRPAFRARLSKSFLEFLKMSSLPLESGDEISGRFSWRFRYRWNFTWWRGRPTMDGKTARGASSPAKPALHMPEPLSTTKAATSSSHMMKVFRGLA